MKSLIRNLVLLAALLSLTAAARAASLSRSLDTIRAVGPEGKGNAEATAAWKTVSASGSGEIVTILKSVNGANDLAANWLRSAVDTIAARELDAGKKLPVAALEKFLADTKNDSSARRMAFDLIARANPEKGTHLLMSMVNDPSPELRREAVQREIDSAASAVREFDMIDKKDLSRRESRNLDAVALELQLLLLSARDADQVEAIAKLLKTLGKSVDLAKLFGWVWDWKVIGPFDSTGGVGFDKVYPPEEKIDLAAEYDGKNGKVRWLDITAHGDRGLADMNKPLGALKGVAAYAYTEFYSDTDRPVELRLGCKNAWKVWLNGKFLFGRDEYHRGMEIDQYRMAGELKKGKNVILVKICQNEQTEQWTKEWEFQLRVTDPLGAVVASAKK